MRSKWYESKETVMALRRDGTSMTVIERRYGIPRSTLSGWFKEIQLTEKQRVKLLKNKHDGWAKARIRAVERHKAQKAERLLAAKEQALKTLSKLELSDEVLDLAFAMLYLGEGAKAGTTSIASSDPKILKFVLVVLGRNYGIKAEMVRCNLHLRMDQDSKKLKAYWSDELGVPVGAFRYVAYDRRSTGKPTYNSYKGVCVLYCGSIAIQRKLIYLYTLFCEKVATLGEGA